MPHKQREILRDIVRKIVIEKEGARVFYYSLPQEDLLHGIAMAIELKLVGKQETRGPKGSDPLPDGGSSNVLLNGTSVTTPEHFYIVDFIPGVYSPTRIDARSVVRLYKEGLSAQQVADRVGISKHAVLARLRQLGVRRTGGRGRSADNFRYSRPPYGCRVVSQRLVVNQRELRIARLIV